jgi:GNAT superfamily N-acetyltransferase
MTSWREAPVDDDAALALLTEYFSARAESFPASQGQYRTVFPAAEHFVPPHGVFLVVEHEGADVGCGGIRALDLGDGQRTFEVKHLWLQPHTRGLGLGRSLLQELEARARAFGGGRLVLDTNDSLAAAGGLYRSSGFAEIAPYNDNANATLWFGKSLEA